jgi:hypothetical protein
MSTTSRAADLMTEVFRQWDENCARPSPRSWSFELRNGKPMEARATLGDEWLSLVALPRFEPSSELPWRLLKLNGALSGEARFTRRPRWRSFAIRAEVHVCEATIGARVRDACLQLIDAASLLCGDRVKRREARVLSDTSVKRWRELIAESGWPLPEVDGGRLFVDFPARRGHHRVTIDDDGTATRCGVELNTEATIAAVCREALGVLLLTVTDGLQCVRAAARSEGGRDTAWLEVTLPPAPTCIEVDLAFGSLAAACELVGRPAVALLDQPLAETYLDMQYHHTERFTTHGG